MSVDNVGSSNSDPVPDEYYKPPNLDHTRIQEILSSGGPLEDVFRELEVTPEDRMKYSVLMKDLEELFKKRFKGCKAQAYGSTYTGLCLKDSDIDICMKIDAAQELEDAAKTCLEKELVHEGTRLMYEHTGKFAEIFPIPGAFKPIIKFIHVPTNLSCDLSFGNSMGIVNSSLIKLYTVLDKRVYPYFLLVKYWAHKHDFSGTGKITNYALITLAAFYLQQLEEPVLPTVHRLQELSEEKEHIDGWLCSFSKDPNAVEPSRNTSSLFELLAGFFDYYDKLNIGDVVVCPYLGKTVPKIHFLNTEKLPEPLKAIYTEKVTIGGDLNIFSDLCVQDPFVLTRNITAGIGRRALRGFHDFTRSAVKVCQELHITEEKKKIMVLSKLYSVPPAANSKPSTFTLTDSEISLNIFAVGFLSIAMFPDVAKVLNVEIKEGQSTKLWFLMIQNLVITIFTKIMKFEVQLLVEGTGEKIRKVDSFSDLPHPVDTEDHQKYIVYVETNYTMWNCRRKIQKELEMSNTLPKSHCLDVEEAISNELCRQGLATKCAERPVLTFVCQFSYVNDPPSVKMFFKNKGTRTRRFLQVIKFLVSNISTLIEKYCKYMKIRAKEQYSGSAKPS